MKFAFLNFGKWSSTDVTVDR